jgi:hypothetical protein
LDANFRRSRAEIRERLTGRLATVSQGLPRLYRLASPLVCENFQAELCFCMTGAITCQNSCSSKLNPFIGGKCLYLRYFHTTLHAPWLCLREVVARTGPDQPSQSGATDAMQTRAALSAPLLRQGPLQSIFECLNGQPKARPREWKLRTENSLGPDKHSNPPGDMWGETWTIPVRLGRKHPQSGWKRYEAGESPESWPLMSSISHIVTETQPHS